MYAINKFQVLDFDVTFSDHCPLLVEIQSLFCHETPEFLRKAPHNLKWGERQKVNFEANISKVDKTILNISNNSQLSASEQIDLMVEHMSSTLHGATSVDQKSNLAFKKKNKKRKPKKKWYDADSDFKYRNLKQLSRKLASDPFNRTLRSKVYFERKEYNRLIRKKHRIFKGKLLSGLMESEKRNPKEFWNCVNDLMEKQKVDPSADISSSTWTEYFKSLMNIDYTNNFDEQALPEYIRFAFIDNSVLNRDISVDEVLKAAKNLKNGKSCGIDEISNEMLRISVPLLLEHFTLLFNHILQKGTYPSFWRENIIKPIYKGGGTTTPTNYRGISISSCFSKLFSRILFNRLDDYLECNHIIGPEQIGFRKNCRTSDHILTLKTLIDKAFKSSKYLYACFVDLSKAFDTVNRCALFHKLFKYNIRGPFLNILKDMYASLVCCVKTDAGLSSSFDTKIGVKQGCILSPTLFSIYLNDLNDCFDHLCDPIKIHNTSISSLLYADDIVLISNSAEGLQRAMNKLGNFCQVWNLTVNISKTKVIVFNKSGRILKGFAFNFQQTNVEVVQEYKYLGIVFRASGVFSNAVKYLCVTKP